MKPRVFLSHNKNDLRLIQKIANDLRGAQIDVWFDEWEIPPGDSLRDKIFEDGIPECDLFFVYLSEHSIESHWVKEELDAAFVYEAEQKGGFMAFFVDSEDTRTKLRADIRSKSCPLLTTEIYDKPLRQLISRCWQGAQKRRIEDVARDLGLQLLEEKERTASIQSKLEEFQRANSGQVERLIQYLSSHSSSFGESTHSWKELFDKSAHIFGSGADIYVLDRGTDIPSVGSSIPDVDGPTYRAWDAFVGQMVAVGLVFANYSNTLYYLTALGSLVSQRLKLGEDGQERRE